ncbi:MAG: hypothetical protein VB093_12400 [Propionicimonas sp.]|nr:hypothetical protein [Propionicimonas sp.]
MRSDSQFTMRFHFALGIALVFGQRLGIPIGGLLVPINLIAIVIYLAYGFTKRQLTVAPRALLIWTTFAAGAVVSTVLAVAPVSPLSLFQVLSYWIVLTCRTRQADALPALADGIALSTLAAAAFAVLQVALSIGVGVFVDPFSGLRRDFLIAGYNTTYDVGPLGAWSKANGGVFLEPSFLSLGCAVTMVLIAQGVAFALWSRSVRAVAMLVLLGGIIASTALSGLLLLPLVLLSIVRDLRLATLCTMGLAALGTWLHSHDVVQAYLFRLSEGGSNDARLVRPYTDLLPLALDARPLLGSGAGTADDMARRLTGGSWESEVTAPTLVKLVYEYGLIGLALLLALLGICIVGSRLPVLSRAALLVMLLIPTNGLVNPLVTPVVLLVLAVAAPVEESIPIHAAVRGHGCKSVLPPGIRRAGHRDRRRKMWAGLHM